MTPVSYTCSLPKLTAEQIARFRSYVRPDDSGCHIWTGHKDKQGYGRVVINYKPYRAHRIAYLIAHETPEGYLVCHKCDNHPCVNPDHLFLGTNIENSADRDAKGRTLMGPRHQWWGKHINVGTSHGMAIINEEKAKQIREKFQQGHTQQSLAKEYGMSQAAVWKLIHRLTWAHV